MEEKGTSLSGGQRQRLSIARAIVKKPEILIFDDSTSALDLVTEAKLYKAMRDNIADTTKIVVAQRIATAKNADKETLFSFTVHGTFSVNSGVSASCTKSSYSYSITNKAWELKSASATRSGNKAIANAEFIKKLVFVTVDTFNANIVLTCDSNGKLS